MGSVTMAFLVIGGLGMAVLAVSLLAGDLLSIGHPDAGGPFSLPAIAGFVGAFGFAGAVAAELAPGRGADLAAALGAGAVAAVPTAWLALRMARAAMNMRTDRTPVRADLIGTLGVVVTPIPAGGYGEVQITLVGQPVKLNAKSAQPLPRGAHVFVIAAPSATSVVVEQTPTISTPATEEA